MMSDEASAAVRSGLGDRVRHWEQPSAIRVYFEVAPEHVPDATRLLCEKLGARLQTASGIDGPDTIELLYHWALDGPGVLIMIRTRVERARPELASITPLCPAAEWIERELHELLGIQFRDHPDPRPLLLAEDWPEGNYPLRRDAEGKES